jgi:hypothetical protein
MTPSRYFLQIRVPPAVTAALKTVADREMLSVSDYVRLVLFEKLRVAGIDPAKLVNADRKRRGLDASSDEALEASEVAE